MLKLIQVQRDKLLVELQQEKDRSKQLVKDLSALKKQRNLLRDQLQKQADFQRARLHQGALAKLQQRSQEQSEDQEETLDSLNLQVKDLIDDLMSHMKA